MAAKGHTCDKCHKAASIVTQYVGGIFAGFCSNCLSKWLDKRDAAVKEAFKEFLGK